MCIVKIELIISIYLHFITVESHLIYSMDLIINLI